MSFIQSLEKKYRVDLLDKMNVAYKTDNEIGFTSLADFKNLLKNKSIDEDTIVFNNLVSNIFEYNSNWETSIKNSWHSRFL